MFLTLTLSPAVDCTLTVAGKLQPGAVHHVVEETRTPGGKGINVAKALKSAGADVVVGGLVGAREAGFYETFLEEAGIRTALLVVEHRTRANQMFIDSEGNEMKMNRPGFPELDFDEAPLNTYCLEVAEQADTVVLSGSLPARFPADTYARLVNLLRGEGKVVVLDASGGPLRAGAEAAPEIIKPNCAELGELAGVAVHGEDDILAAIDSIRSRHEAIVVSAGAAGAYFTAAGKTYHAAAPHVTAVDSTGAGDTLLGQFCADYFPGRKLTEAVMRNAVAAGSAAVETRGTPIVPAERVRELADSVRVRGC